MTHNCLPLLTLLCGLALSSAQAQTGADAKADEQTATPPTAASKQTAAPKPKAAAKIPAKDDEGFIPSEAISEDLSVSFPVDI